MSDTADQPLRIGIIGAGLMGGIHAECLEKVPGAQIAGCFNPTRAKAEALVKKHGGQVYDSLDALVSDDAIDAVVIASPQAHHHEQILAAVRAGKHIFCEKPLALTLAELDEVQRVVGEAGITFMTGHQMRLHPIIQQVRAHMADLGPVFHLDLEWAFRIGAPGGRCWESYRLGGFFMELGCHATDLACFLLGQPVNVSGRTLRLNHERVTEDCTHALIQFDSAAIASILVSANHRTKRQGMLVGRVLGENGRIEFTIYPYKRAFNEARLVLDAGESVFVPDTTVTPFPKVQAPSPTKVYPGFFDIYERQAEAFVTAVRKGTEPPCTLADGRNAVELVLATYHEQSEATRTRNLVHRPPQYRSDAEAHPGQRG